MEYFGLKTLKQFNILFRIKLNEIVFLYHENFFCIVSITVHPRLYFAI